MFADIPYFPDAYITRLESNNPKCQKILSRLFKEDWLNDLKAHDKFGKPFRTMVRCQENIEGINIKRLIKMKRFIRRKLYFLLK